MKFRLFETTVSRIRSAQTAHVRMFASREQLMYGSGSLDYEGYVIRDLGRQLGDFIVADRRAVQVDKRNVYERNQVEFELSTVVISPQQFNGMVSDLRAALIDELAVTDAAAYKRGYEAAEKVLTAALVKNLLK